LADILLIAEELKERNILPKRFHLLANLSSTYNEFGIIPVASNVAAAYFPPFAPSHDCTAAPQQPIKS
jgi:hypothetical protein